MTTYKSLETSLEFSEDSVALSTYSASCAWNDSEPTFISSVSKSKYTDYEVVFVTLFRPLDNSSIYTYHYTGPASDASLYPAKCSPGDIAIAIEQNISYYSFGDQIADGNHLSSSKCQIVALGNATVDVSITGDEE